MTTEPRLKRANAALPDSGEWKLIGLRAKAMRLRLELSLDEVAAKAGVSKSTISRFERGFDSVLSAVVAICQALGFNPFELTECQHEYACKFCDAPLASQVR